ncbi:lipopolysaccharide biosynthesis protein [Paenibacillus sp. KN14-4R]|uniref:lipopolysaccharide biosynthesis protein n=1 Tax=Paenibacillus sp. KN14-4R TaxID=3445773 RepID=UPI003F9FAB30
MIWNIVRQAGQSWKNGSFIKHVIILASGTAFAQGLGILVSPILTRLYNPEQFGKLAVYISILSLLTTFSTFGYERAISLEEDEARSENIVYLCFSICVAFCLLIVGLLIGFHSFIQDTWNMGIVVWLLPLGLLGIGFYNTLNFWALRQKAFHSISRTKWTQGIGGIVIQLLAPFIGLGKLGLVYADVFGRMAGSGTLFTLFMRQKKRVHPEQHTRLDWRQMLQLASKYRKFPMLITGSSLLNIAALQLMPLFMSMYYGLETVGMISLVNKVLGGPMLLISMSVSQVFYAEAAQLVRDHPRALNNLWKQTALKLCKFGLPPMLLAVLVGPYLFEVVFGSDWSRAGDYVQFYAVLYAANFLFSPLSVILEVLQLQHWHFLWNLFRLISTLLGFYFTLLSGLNSHGAILVYILIMSFFYCLIYYLCKHALRRQAIQLKAQEDSQPLNG